MTLKDIYKIRYIEAISANTAINTHYFIILFFIGIVIIDTRKY